MTDMERRNFEDSFKNAFDGAEIPPSENVWTNIELELEKAEGGKIRRRLMFYKLLAAASIAFAMCVAGIGYYMVTNNTLHSVNSIASGETGLENNENAENNENEEVKSNLPDNNPQNGHQEQSNRSADAQKQTRDRHGDNQNVSPDKNAVTDNHIIIAKPSESGKTTVDKVQSTVTQDNLVAEGANVPSTFNNDPSVSYNPNSVERKLPAFYNAETPTLDSHIIKPDPGTLLLARLADEERRYADEDKKKENDKSEKLWTSLGFAAGGFSSVNHSVAAQPSSTAFLLANSTVPDKQSKAAGVAYSFGVNVGTRVSKRWVLQGGINYLTQSSDYVATNVVGDNNLQGLRAESINELDKISQLPQGLADNTANKL
ncbi:MAG: hypothetical protein C0490_22275, partial [Marivirga sp.]|nr:hypothetical protein [Marivirga sp.]